MALGAALALPLATLGRGTLLLITFAVILVNLVGQGLTLPLVTCLLRIGGDGTEGREEVHARTVAADTNGTSTSVTSAAVTPGRSITARPATSDDS